MLKGKGMDVESNASICIAKQFTFCDECKQRIQDDSSILIQTGKLVAIICIWHVFLILIPWTNILTLCVFETDVCDKYISEQLHYLKTVSKNQPYAIGLQRVSVQASTLTLLKLNYNIKWKYEQFKPNRTIVHYQRVKWWTECAPRIFLARWLYAADKSSQSEGRAIDIY